MSAHDDYRGVLLRRAVESPGRFADVLRGRYLRTGGRIRTAGGTLADRPAPTRIEHHHHARSTTSTQWRSSFALHTTLVLPTDQAQLGAAEHRLPVPRPGSDAGRAGRMPRIDITTPTSPDRAPGRSGLEPTRQVLRNRVPTHPAQRVQLQDIRATPRIRHAETVLARPRASIDEHHAPAGFPPQSPLPTGTTTAWPTTSAPAAPVPIPAAEVDRITRQVITTIDQRLSAYRERQGRG